MHSDIPPNKIVACPSCKRDAVFSSSNAYRPFCSARCKGIDLGSWANESFRLEAQTPPDDQAFGDAGLQ